MEKEIFKEILTIIVASAILGLAVSFPSFSIIFSSAIYFLIIITLNVLVKKIYAYHLEADAKTKFWSLYQFWWTKRSHFKKPIPMLWVPLLLSIVSKGYLLWLAVLEFDIKARVERVSKKHGLYRFSEMTDWNIALIAASGIIINLILAIIGYFSGFETFAKLNIYYAFWSLIPIGGLDGSKILFGSRTLWFTILIIVSIFLGYSFIIV